MAALSADKLAFIQSMKVFSFLVLPVMAVIFDLLVPQLRSVHISLTELLNPKDVDEAFGNLLQSSVDAEILHYFLCTVLPVMAAIFDFPLTPMSKSVHTSPAVLLDPPQCGCSHQNLVDILYRS